ncbi:MAG: triose-phosphate isomerase [Bdellovibrionales bacterium RIFCSPHIGHO2_01_FULL_40_29]|nr:MAG: triose-phosphate isomerase [Bdellovibrionales bacterium RIFCSPHIGHO2_01_FULL_40_29]OFZ33379.1 MAG: triose-phosphate isomerase [Bdellovibrionales bacterium RIFCSPHIGHO2_02_FULL_40_15]
MKKIFAANWKLNKSPLEATKFIQDFMKLAANGVFNQSDVLIFPSAFSMDAVSKACAGTKIQFGPQNIFSEKSGAFTGENSAEVAVQLGAQFFLVGHSERRQLFSEVDALLNQKVKLLQSLKVIPVFCIGETLDQRDAELTETVCFSQIEKGLAGIDTTQRLIVAYEPVWAIGTGKVATRDQVAEIHQKIFDKLTSMGFQNFQLLYGGSVKPENAKELLQVPHVHGFLIGGASLDPNTFYKICQS